MAAIGPHTSEIEEIGRECGVDVLIVATLEEISLLDDLIKGRGVCDELRLRVVVLEECQEGKHHVFHFCRQLLDMMDSTPR